MLAKMKGFDWEIALALFQTRQVEPRLENKCHMNETPSSGLGGLTTPGPRQELPTVNQSVDQPLIWHCCVSTYERPTIRASAKNLRESAIGCAKQDIWSCLLVFS